MDIRIRLFTQDTIVHNQIASIEKILGRPIGVQVTLNVRNTQSTIEFDVNEEELEKIKYDLGYNVFVHDGKRWLPHL